MPNHFHCIIEIVGTGLKPVPTDIVKNHSLSEIIRGFKTFSARFINQQQKMQGRNIWQRSFYDHIIRNEIELNKILEYILINPKMWERDRNNAENILM
ncbi:MAG: transposase [Candidatus Moraniibacteriota bacterium]